MKAAKKQKFSQGAIAVAVSLMFQPQPLLANPTGAQVANGVVSMVKPNAATLNVTNSPGTIINWQGFSIGAGEVTRFIQQSSSSAVLNRVVGADISSIQGQLLSNGRVFLINPAGIIIGPNAMIDTAGFVGSALNMQNADFLAGKLRFSGDANSGTIINQGWIRTSYGGNVLLVAPRIENSGLIQTPGGELILAAGQKLTVSSLEHEGVQFEVQAPTDSVVNIGKLLADGGAVGVFAGTLKHSGEIRANALVRDEGGNVVLKAANDIQIAAGSIISASGKSGGAITIESGAAHTRVAGQVLATGTESKGGSISILGDRVTATDGALIDASGATGGGQILLGGDYQGANATVRNAGNTFVGSNAMLRADATQSGDGGRIIVWGNDNTRFYGTLSAQGGPLGGNGGFAEVSGKQNLIFDGVANLGAPKGALGNLLLDPLDLYVFTAGGIDSKTGGTKASTLMDEATDFPSNAVTVSPLTLAGVAGNVTLFASRYLRISNDITLTTPGQSLTATVGKYTAPALPDPNALDTITPNRLDVAANITTMNGAVTLNAPLIQSVATSKIATTGGAIALTSGAAISASQLSLDAGAGALSLAVGAAITDSITLAAVSGGSVTATAPGSVSFGSVTTGAGALSLTSTGSFVNPGAVTSGGGAVTINAPLSSISTGAITGGSAPVTLSGKGNISTGIIDTTGAVALTVTGGSIFTTINNSSGVTASSANSINSTSININSTTALNANSIIATAMDCNSSASCPGATISLTATGDINVGTLTANAPATTNNALVFNNAISRNVTVTSNGGSIFAAIPAASLITATDVTLTTKQASGGGIGTAAAALKVDTERLLSVSPNGDFNVVAVGKGPTQLNAQPGVAAAGKTYSGTLVRSGGGLTLNASATDTTVTVSNLTATGFTQRLYNSNPLITLGTPNGALTATTVSVPEGDTRPNDPPLTVPFYTTAALPVNISASGALTVTSYTRQSTAASLPKTTSFSSSTGAVNLGAIVASKDPVTVTAAGPGSNVSVTNLTTSANVTITANSGDITVGRIDTTSGTGSVSLNASTLTGTVKAQTDSGALEVTSGSTIDVSGKTIGASTFTNPLDLAGSAITFTSNNAVGGAIGFAAAPVVANTQALTLNASATTFSPTTTGASFNLNTGATALKSLTVTASAQAVGKGGPATVTTEGGKGVYTFASDGKNFTFNAGTVPTANQFANGALSFTSNSGDITLGAANMGATGGLSVTASTGSILGGAALDGGGAITLSAGASNSGANAAVNVGDVGAVNRPSSLTITSGNSGRLGTVITKNIEAGGVTINSFQGGITLGNIGAVARAGTVQATSNRFNTSNVGDATGAITTGNTTVAGLTLDSLNNTITTGNVDATGTVFVLSTAVLNTGTVNAGTFNVFTCFLCTRPQVTTGAISGVRDMFIDGRLTTINGPVTGDPAGSGTLSISAFPSGLLTVTGAITAGDGSTVSLNSNGTVPFAFTSINAGATGNVQINSPSGIQQTAAGGITAKTVNLQASSATAPINRVTGLQMDLFGTQVLTVDAGGPVALNANGSTLSALTITKRATPAVAAFTLANLGGGQMVSIANGANPFELSVNSPASPLDFSLAYSAGKINLVGSGIVTSGGLVSVSAGSGALDATVGGIRTGGAIGGGTVNLSASGLLTTGTVNTTPTGKGTGGAISVSVSGVLVNGDLRTGTGGGGITLNTSGAAITRSGGAQIVSDTSVSVSVNAASTDIAAAGTPLLITSPNVALSARGFPVGGNVFATLTNTKTLNLSGDNGFNVTSNTAFDTLSVATRGSGTGAMTLTAPGQTYSFARPATDLFGGAMTNTFQVVAAAGATPAANATFMATDGDLFVGGAGTSITTAALTLSASGSGGDVKLQGTAANPLVLTNTIQNIGNGFSTRDLLVRGNVALTGTTQNLTTSHGITVQAEQGTITITGVDQSITTGDTLTNGIILFKGGAAANQTVAVTASNTQLLQSPNSIGAASIQFQGGDGAGSSATLIYTGAGTQTVQGGGNVSLKGGVGTNAIGEIRTATGAQLIRSASSVDVTAGSGAGAAARIVNTGTGNQQVGESRGSTFPFSPQPYQTSNVTVAAGAGADAVAEITAVGPQQIFVRSGTLAVQGGAGTNAFARIDNAASTEQLIGCASYSGGCIDAIGTINIGNVLATGAGAYSRITGAGAQRVTANTAINLTGSVTGASATMTGAGQDIRLGSSGSLALAAGTGNNANALVQSSATQIIGGINSFSFGNMTLSGLGSAGATATAQITASGNQTIGRANVVTLSGGAGDNSQARLASTGASQSLTYNSMTISGGSGSGSSVEIVSSGNQSLSGSATTLKGGTGANALAQITAAGTQTLSGSGSLTLTGGGTAATPVANASATIQGNSQQFNVGNVSLTGGNGAAGNVSDAVLRNLSGNQSIAGNGLVQLIGGAQFSTTGILNQGTGTQSVTGSSGISLTTVPGANNNTSVLIQNTPVTQQTLTSNFGGLHLNNQGAGVLAVTSGGAQTVTSAFVNVVTSAGATGDAVLSAAGNQWIRTTNGLLTPTGSMRVAALGTGTANIESGASQLIELDYPGQMQGLTLDGRLTIGDTAAAGKSRVGAVDQTVFAKSVLVQTGGPGAGTQSELKSSGKQVISLLNGNLDVLGGSGNNSLAQIDPTDQTILGNGAVNVTGGSGTNAVARIISQGTQTLWTTNGNINITGGSGAGSSASITAAGVQSLNSSTPPPVLTPNVGGAFTGGAAAPSTSSSSPSSPTGNVLALQDNQSGVIAESEPGSQNESDPIRRAPICF